MFSWSASIGWREKEREVSCPPPPTNPDMFRSLTKCEPPLHSILVYFTPKEHGTVLHAVGLQMHLIRNAISGWWLANRVNHVQGVGFCHRMQMSPHEVKLPAHQSSRCLFNGLTICSPQQKVAMVSWKYSQKH